MWLQQLEQMDAESMAARKQPSGGPTVATPPTAPPTSNSTPASDDSKNNSTNIGGQEEGVSSPSSKSGVSPRNQGEEVVLNLDDLLDNGDDEESTASLPEEGEGEVCMVGAGMGGAIGQPGPGPSPGIGEGKLFMDLNGDNARGGSGGAGSAAPRRPTSTPTASAGLVAAMVASAAAESKDDGDCAAADKYVTEQEHEAEAEAEDKEEEDDNDDSYVPDSLAAFLAEAESTLTDMTSSILKSPDPRTTRGSGGDVDDDQDVDGGNVSVEMKMELDGARLADPPPPPRQHPRPPSTTAEEEEKASSSPAPAPGRVVKKEDRYAPDPARCDTVLPAPSSESSVFSGILSSSTYAHEDDVHVQPSVSAASSTERRVTEEIGSVIESIRSVRSAVTQPQPPTPTSSSTVTVTVTATTHNTTAAATAPTAAAATAPVTTTPEAHHPNLFSPMSGNLGPYDAESGSACRPNPAGLYKTETEAKAEAMTEGCSCPERGTEHVCHDGSGATVAGAAEVSGSRRVGMDIESEGAEAEAEANEAEMMQSPPQLRSSPSAMKIKANIRDKKKNNRAQQPYEPTKSTTTKARPRPSPSPTSYVSPTSSTEAESSPNKPPSPPRRKPPSPSRVDGSPAQRKAPLPKFKSPPARGTATNSSSEEKKKKKKSTPPPPAPAPSPSSAAQAKPTAKPRRSPPSYMSPTSSTTTRTSKARATSTTAKTMGTTKKPSSPPPPKPSPSSSSPTTTEAAATATNKKKPSPPPPKPSVPSSSSTTSSSSLAGALLRRGIGALVGGGSSGAGGSTTSGGGGGNNNKKKKVVPIDDGGANGATKTPSPPGPKSTAGTGTEVAPAAVSPAANSSGGGELVRSSPPTPLPPAVETAWEGSSYIGDVTSPCVTSPEEKSVQDGGGADAGAAAVVMNDGADDGLDDEMFFPNRNTAVSAASAATGKDKVPTRPKKPPSASTQKGTRRAVGTKPTSAKSSSNTKTVSSSASSRRKNRTMASATTKRSAVAAGGSKGSVPSFMSPTRSHEISSGAAVQGTAAAKKKRTGGGGGGGGGGTAATIRPARPTSAVPARPPSKKKPPPPPPPPPRPASASAPPKPPPPSFMSPTSSTINRTRTGPAALHEGKENYGPSSRDKVSIDDAVAKAKERVRQQKLKEKKLAETKKTVSQPVRRSVAPPAVTTATANRRIKEYQDKMRLNTDGGEEDKKPKPPTAWSKSSERSRHEPLPKTPTKLTVPHAPHLKTTDLHGAKVYAAVGRHGGKAEENPICSETHGRESAGREGPPRASHGGPTRKELTIPKPPRLSTLKKYGDKPCPTTHATDVDEWHHCHDAGDRPATSVTVDAAAKDIPHVTNPVPFKFHSRSKAADCLDPSASTPAKPEPSLAESMELFQRKGLRDGGGEGSRPGTAGTARSSGSMPELTVPKPFKFSESTPKKKPLPKSSEEREEEMMEQFRAHPFKAKPFVDGGGVGGGGGGVPKIPKKHLTTPEPFKFRSDVRHANSVPPPPTSEELKALECKNQFRARSVPRLSSRPPQQPKSQVQKRVLTTPKPFTLRSEVRHANMPPPPPTPDEIELSKQFHAKPIPKSANKPFTTQKRTEELMTPNPPRLHSSQRSETRHAVTERARLNVMAKLEEKKRLLEIKKREEFEVNMAKAPSSTTPLQRRGMTMPAPFNLESEARHDVAQAELHAKKLEEIEESKKMATSFRAKPMPSSVTRRPRPVMRVKGPEEQDLTEPAPFNLESVDRHAHYMQEFKDKLAEEEAKRKHMSIVRARPVPRSTYRVSPRVASQKELVVPVAPTLRSQQQAVHRKEFDDACSIRREEDLLAKKMVEEQREAEMKREIKEMRSLPTSEGGMRYVANPINGVPATSSGLDSSMRSHGSLGSTGAIRLQ